MRVRLSEAMASWQDDLLKDLQRHHRINFPGSVTLKIVSPF
jgi:hypothetical protein